MKKDNGALAPWIKRFLLEYLPGDRNFARNTQQSYRDALRLLVVFASTTLHKKPDELLVEDLGANLLRKFMRHLEEKRKCSISTRNQRLAGVHTLARFIAKALTGTSLAPQSAVSPLERNAPDPLPVGPNCEELSSD
jgi:integrase/recombinase XerD